MLRMSRYAHRRIGQEVPTLAQQQAAAAAKRKVIPLHLGPAPVVRAAGPVPVRRAVMMRPPASTDAFSMPPPGDISPNGNGGGGGGAPTGGMPLWGWGVLALLLAAGGYLVARQEEHVRRPKYD